jgi:hypothetical protein
MDARTKRTSCCLVRKATRFLYWRHFLVMDMATSRHVIAVCLDRTVGPQVHLVKSGFCVRIRWSALFDQHRRCSDPHRVRSDWTRTCSWTMCVIKVGWLYTLQWGEIDHFTVPCAILKDSQAFASKRNWNWGWSWACNDRDLNDLTWMIVKRGKNGLLLQAQLSF